MNYKLKKRSTGAGVTVQWLKSACSACGSELRPPASTHQVGNGDECLSPQCCGAEACRSQMLASWFRQLVSPGSVRNPASKDKMVRCRGRQLLSTSGLHTRMQGHVHIQSTYMHTLIYHTQQQKDSIPILNWCHILSFGNS